MYIETEETSKEDIVKSIRLINPFYLGTEFFDLNYVMKYQSPLCNSIFNFCVLKYTIKKAYSQVTHCQNITFLFSFILFSRLAIKCWSCWFLGQKFSHCRSGGYYVDFSRENQNRWSSKKGISPLTNYVAAIFLSWIMINYGIFTFLVILLLV